MKIFLLFDPEDGTGPLRKEWNSSHYKAVQPHDLWYRLVKMMKEAIHDWKWMKAGKPTWDEEEKRLAWKAETMPWTAPIDEMIAAVKEKEA